MELNGGKITVTWGQAVQIAGIILVIGYSLYQLQYLEKETARIESRMERKINRLQGLEARLRAVEVQIHCEHENQR